jgi:hypothetical protein
MGAVVRPAASTGPASIDGENGLRPLARCAAASSRNARSPSSPTSSKGPALIEPVELSFDVEAGAAEGQPIDLSLWPEPATESDGLPDRPRQR